MLSLMELAEKHNAVLDTLRELFASRKSKDRFIIIAYLRGALPRDFLLDIVGKGLTDKSSQIRWKAHRTIFAAEKSATPSAFRNPCLHRDSGCGLLISHAACRA
jgi:hypothetical protein